MQHASDDVVSQWKSGILSSALAAQGLGASVSRVETSPPETRRRAKLTGRRTKKGAIVGFHAARSDDVVAIPDCRILAPGLRAAFAGFEALARLAATRSTDAELHITETENGADVGIKSPRDLDQDLRETLPRLASDHGICRITWNDEPVATLAPPVLRVSGIPVEPPPGAFLQATAHGETVLAAQVAGIVSGANRVADLFSGCGTFSLPLARRAVVHAVEGDERLLTALDRAWREAPGLKTITTETRDLFRRPLLPDELRVFDAIVIDPPRAGAEAQIGELAKGGPDVIAMVSCNPVTFARDARVLVSAGYDMAPPVIVDQFRWSAHLEIVCGFTK
jgi:23S rRNA (uracil1939-C5)-methyltransferase